MAATKRTNNDDCTVDTDNDVVASTLRGRYLLTVDRKMAPVMKREDFYKSSYGQSSFVL